MNDHTCPQRPKFNWDRDGAIQLLLALRNEGYSASQIASCICKKFGLRDTQGPSRSAVIGKLNRMGLHLMAPQGGDHRPIGVRQKPGRKPKRRLGPGKFQPNTEPARAILTRKVVVLAPPMPLPPDDPAPADAKAILDLDAHDCRWPYGSHDHRFCSRPAVPGLSYCEGHAAKAFAQFDLTRHVERLERERRGRKMTEAAE